MTKGIALKSVSLFVRIIQFLTSVVILAIFAYFLASLSNHDLPINNHIRATAGISGAAIIYTIIGFLFVCCLGGIAFFGYISILLDIAFAGAFGYIAWVNRGGASSCRGTVNTVYGAGNASNGNRIQTDDGRFTNVPSFRTSCRLQTACFAVAIVGAVFFLLSIPLSLMLVKHHKKEKAFGPGPKNGYTAGTGPRRFWQRKPKHSASADAEYGMAGGKAVGHNNALPAHTTPSDMRTSYATDTTAVGDQAYGNTSAHNKYANNQAPVGTAVPQGQGYDRRSGAATGTF